MTAADIQQLREQVNAAADRLRSLSLASLASPTAPGERSRAAAALAVAQLLADLDAVVREKPSDVPADDDVVYAGEAAVGDQIAVIGRELAAALEGMDRADPSTAAVCTAATDAVAALRMEL